MRLIALLLVVVATGSSAEPRTYTCFDGDRPFQKSTPCEGVEWLRAPKWGEGPPPVSKPDPFAYYYGLVDAMGTKDYTPQDPPYKASGNYEPRRHYHHGHRYAR